MFADEMRLRNAGAPGTPHAPSLQGILGSAQGHGLPPQRQPGTAGRAAPAGLGQGPGLMAALSARQDQDRGSRILPPSKPDAECPKEAPSENPVSYEDPPAAVTPGLKAEAHDLHHHRPIADTEKEDGEEGSAQPIANQDEPPNALPRQAGVAEEGRPFVALPGTLTIRLSRMVPSVRQPESVRKALIGTFLLPCCSHCWTPCRHARAAPAADLY